MLVQLRTWALTSPKQQLGACGWASQLMENRAWPPDLWCWEARHDEGRGWQVAACDSRQLHSPLSPHLWQVVVSGVVQATVLRRVSGL